MSEQLNPAPKLLLNVEEVARCSISAEASSTATSSAAGSLLSKSDAAALSPKTPFMSSSSGVRGRTERVPVSTLANSPPPVT